MKYYNFDTMFGYLKSNLCEYLKANNIYYEVSAGAALWHFEILIDPTGAEKINNYIDSVSICEEVI